MARNRRKLPVETLARLIQLVRAGGTDSRAALSFIRAYFESCVQESIHERLLKVFGNADEYEFSLLRKEIERRTWREAAATIARLEQDEEQAENVLVALATGVAQKIISAYSAFQAVWDRCAPEFRPLIASHAREDSEVSELEYLVREQSWFSHRYVSDCAELQKFVLKEAASISSLRASPVEDRFAMFRKYMMGTCQRMFPFVSPVDREDIVQQAALRLVKYSQAEELGRNGRWRGIVRTAVFWEGANWLKREGRA